MKEKHILILAILFALVNLIACGDSSMSPAGPTGPTQPPALSIQGSVTSFAFVPVSYSNDYGNINYIVTTTSNRAVNGCYVEVKWLDSVGVQVAYTYAATNYSIPRGQSTITNQDFVHKDTAKRIKNSIVEYRLCQ